MKEETRLVFITEDGTEFDSREAAERHEAIAETESFLRSLGVRILDASELSEELAKHADQLILLLEKVRGAQ